MAFSKLKALLRKAAERTILGLLRKIGRIAKAFLVAGSFYTATLFELTHVQAITLRIVVGISATGLTASTIVLVQIIPLNSGLAKAFIVAGSLAAGAAGYTGLPAHQKGNAVEDNFRVRDGNLEEQLKTIRGRLDFCSSTGLSAALREKLQDELSRFIVYLQDTGFQSLEGRVSVCIYSKEASPPDPPLIFYLDDTLYIHRAMSEYMSVVLREYSHYALSKVSMLPFPSEVESALADYFPASFLGSALIGDKLGALFGLSRPFIRNLDNDLKYAAVINQPDQRGEVWGGALWTCRQEPGVGTSVVDRAAFDAWRLAGQAPSNPELAKQFGAGLGARDGQVGQCLAQEIAKRGIPH